LASCQEACSSVPEGGHRKGFRLCCLAFPSRGLGIHWVALPLDQLDINFIIDGKHF